MEAGAPAGENAQTVAAALVAGLRAQLPAAGFTLGGVEVQLGELVDLSADALREAMEGELPGIEVRITVVRGALKCQDCGAEYPSDEHPCPVCGSGRAELIHGTELTIARAWGAGT
jgi:Zn finger protein HypA/HybF involved in hydrogenase expression